MANIKVFQKSVKSYVIDQIFKIYGTVRKALS